jgi:hypothetical protein
VIVGEKLEVPLSRIYYIATFYKSFSLEPRGRHMISGVTPGRVEKMLSTYVAESEDTEGEQD